MKCEDCKYYVNENYPQSGVCKRHPPTVVVGKFTAKFRDKIYADLDSISYEHPEVRGGSFCGEFVERGER